MSGDEVIGVFRDLGFEISGQSGSHVKLIRVTGEGNRQTLTIPKHKELDAGTLQAIVRQAGRYVDQQVLRQHFYTP
jgi:predicted RNA binding protein YcfA (HicA-like mRNA interferase family)